MWEHFLGLIAQSVAREVAARVWVLLEERWGGSGSLVSEAGVPTATPTYEGERTTPVTGATPARGQKGGAT